MAKLLIELIAGIVRAVIADVLFEAFQKVAAWLDPKVHGRLKLVVGLALGVGAYFLIPIVLGLFAL